MNFIDDDAMIGGSLPYLSANASSAACFEFKESKDSPSEEFKTVRGVIFGAHRGNSCWQFPGGPFPNHQIICRAGVHGEPAAMNPALTANEQQLVEGMGWTGNCKTCGMAQKGGYRGFKPEQHLVFWWENGNRAVILNFKGWKGFLVVGAFLSRFKARRSSDFIVEFTMERKSEGGNNYAVPVCKEVGPVEDLMRETMADLAMQYAPLARTRAVSGGFAAKPALPAFDDCAF